MNICFFFKSNELMTATGWDGLKCGQNTDECEKGPLFSDDEDDEDTSGRTDASL